MISFQNLITGIIVRAEQGLTLETKVISRGNVDRHDSVLIPLFSCGSVLY
jgi:hypothetical protein